MRLKLYRAANVAEAISLLRAELGTEALILSTRRTAGGVELTAALEGEDIAPLAPATSSADLNYHGIPASIAARLTRSDLPSALRSLLRFEPLPIDPNQGEAPPRPLLLAGAPGAGKTLSIARLATRLVLAGTPPVVITADGRRAGAAEELAAYTRLLGISLLVVNTPANLTRALATQPEQSSPPPVLIDTAGANPFADRELARLAELVGVSGAVPVLVMPAGQHPDEAAEQASAFAVLGIRHLLATRLDLVRRLGSLITASLAGDLALTEAGIGAGPTDSLVPLTPEFLADRLCPHPAAATPAANGRAASEPPDLPAQPTFPTVATVRGGDPLPSNRYEADGYRN